MVGRSPVDSDQQNSSEEEPRTRFALPFKDRSGSLMLLGFKLPSASESMVRADGNPTISGGAHPCLKSRVADLLKSTDGRGPMHTSYLFIKKILSSSLHSTVALNFSSAQNSRGKGEIEE